MNQKWKDRESLACCCRMQLCRWCSRCNADSTHRVAGAAVAHGDDDGVVLRRELHALRVQAHEAARPRVDGVAASEEDVRLVQKDASWPRHSGGSTARKCRSWPSFRTNVASFPPAQLRRQTRVHAQDLLLDDLSPGAAPSLYAVVGCHSLGIYTLILLPLPLLSFDFLSIFLSLARRDRKSTESPG